VNIYKIVFKYREFIDVKLHSRIMLLLT